MAVISWLFAWAIPKQSERLEGGKEEGWAE